MMQKKSIPFVIILTTLFVGCSLQVAQEIPEKNPSSQKAANPITNAENVPDDIAALNDAIAELTKKKKKALAYQRHFSREAGRLQTTDRSASRQNYQNADKFASQVADFQSAIDELSKRKLHLMNENND
jgi:hypothetical protein